MIPLPRRERLGAGDVVPGRTHRSAPTAGHGCVGVDPANFAPRAKRVGSVDPGWRKAGGSHSLRSITDRPAGGDAKTAIATRPYGPLVADMNPLPRRERFGEGDFMIGRTHRSAPTDGRGCVGVDPCVDPGWSRAGGSRPAPTAGRGCVGVDPCVDPGRNGET